MSSENKILSDQINLFDTKHSNVFVRSHDLQFRYCIIEDLNLWRMLPCPNRSDTKHSPVVYSFRINPCRLFRSYCTFAYEMVCPVAKFYLIYRNVNLNVQRTLCITSYKRLELIYNSKIFQRNVRHITHARTRTRAHTHAHARVNDGKNITIRRANKWTGFEHELNCTTYNVKCNRSDIVFVPNELIKNRSHTYHHDTSAIVLCLPTPYTNYYVSIL